MPEILEEIDAYKHMLKVAEDLLHFAGLPEELTKKFHLLKEKTFQKVRLTKEDLERKPFCYSHLQFHIITDSQGPSSQGSKAVIEDFATLIEYLFSSQNTLYEKLQNILADVDNKPNRTYHCHFPLFEIFHFLI